MNSPFKELKIYGKYPVGALIVEPSDFGFDLVRICGPNGKAKIVLCSESELCAQAARVKLWDIGFKPPPSEERLKEANDVIIAEIGRVQRNGWRL